MKGKKSVEQVFAEVVPTLSPAQREALIAVLRNMNSANVAAEMAAAVTPTSVNENGTDADRAQLAAMQTYIDRTPMPNRSHYQLIHNETCALYCEAQCDQVRALFMAFDYGMAKGYRAAQKAIMPTRRA